MPTEALKLYKDCDYLRMIREFTLGTTYCMPYTALGDMIEFRKEDIQETQEDEAN